MKKLVAKLTILSMAIFFITLIGLLDGWLAALYFVGWIILILVAMVIFTWSISVINEDD